MYQKELSKLGLHLPTDPRWVNLAAFSLEEILSDHAFCEQKAASACISLIQLFPDKTELVEKVSPVGTEEGGHFRMVVAELKKRKLKLQFQRKDEYVSQLIQFQQKGLNREEKLLELLLTCALIEARSCERFRLLSLHLEEENLKEFYHQFMVSEAGHYRMFLDLAEYYFPKEKVRSRWQEYLEHEALILQKFEQRRKVMH